jgi:hypothetical protein
MRRWVDCWIELHCIGMGFGYRIGIARCLEKLVQGMRYLVYSYQG